MKDSINIPVMRIQSHGLTLKCQKGLGLRLHQKQQAKHSSVFHCFFLCLFFLLHLGTDESGEHVHACMYYDLWTNNPKEMTEFPEYTYEKHFGKPVPSFVPGPVLKDYIEGQYSY